MQIRLDSLKCVLRYLLNSYYSMSHRLLHPPTPQEIELVEELKSEFQQLPQAVAKGDSEAEERWVRHRNQLRHLVLHKNAREFLQWNVVTETMLVGSGFSILEEFRYLRKKSDWRNRWKTAIRESPYGCPRPFLFFPQTSANLIHNAYHLCQLEEKTGFSLENTDLVVEFGGGYGSMCRLIHQLGFTGVYIIFDLPEFCALQNFFLKCLQLPVQSVSRSSNVKGIFLISEIERFKEMLLSMDVKDSAFIATWSLSEVPMELRRSFLPLVSGFKIFLLSYQENFGEVDNLDFFNSWRNSLEQTIAWQDFGIDHLPGNRYLFGVRKNAHAV